jgi:3',5'-cyclic AMP phosphodiesterase CpdA
MRIAMITDVHLGPVEYKNGKPAKLTHHAEPLTRAFVDALSREKPDVIVNLGDVLQDEDHARDLENYTLFCELLSSARLPVLHVAGNHDQVNLSDEELCAAWSKAGLHVANTHYSCERAGYHFVVLSTVWNEPNDVHLPTGQLEWFERDLAQAQRPVVVLSHQSLSEMNLTGNRWFSEHAHMALIRERAQIRALMARHRVVAAFNGHVHWNHVDVLDGIPFVTLQSLTENAMPEGEPAPAASYAVVDVDPHVVHVRVEGRQPCRFQFHR